MVSMMCPDCNTTRIPLEKPIIIQATAISVKLVAIFSAMVFGPHPMIRELTIPMIKKTADKSSKYHPFTLTPHTMTAIPAARVASTNFSRIPNG